MSTCGFRAKLSGFYNKANFFIHVKTFIEHYMNESVEQHDLDLE